ncbi:MAG TPA: acetate--CoA ligase family protein [Candidatus Polarisedimenticolaceae bacterium]|nr:acetate--CoA ligase family protein [Candidatus Polarisedimenticolaceae bacterium]
MPAARSTSQSRSARSKRRQPRERRSERHPLDAIFRPRSVAIVGASRRTHSIGREILHNLIDFGFSGPCYPINPNATAVLSIPTYRTLADVPGPIDLAVIVVPRDHVLQVVDECAKKGVNGIVVITAGFKEVGEEGRQLESRLKRKLERHGIRMVGPNCMGVINTEKSIRLNATFAAAVPPRGNVGFISQSGALGEAILANASGAGIGVSMFVSMGNKTDISGNDLLEYWEHNDDVQVILMSLESFGNPRRFTQLARRVTRKKPIVTVKAGRTAAGARAATSHTGSIVGLDVATDSLLEQCGVLRVNSLEQMFVQAAALANQPVPRGGRIAIVTNAGGPGILCTDSLSGRGVELAEFRPATRKALRKALPPEASTANPVDMIASADARQYRAVLELVKRDPGVDGIIAIFVSPIMIDAFEVARAIAEASDGSKPVLSVFMGKNRSREGLQELARHRVPVYRFPEEAASAMGAMVNYQRLRDAPLGTEVKFEVDRARALRAIRSARHASRSALRAAEVDEVLAAYGLPIAPSVRVRSAAEAIAAAQAMGYPVVLKIDSERYSHKTDVGGVKVDLRNGDEVAAACGELKAALGRRDPTLEFRVQRMVRGGREVILGMTRDPQFGALILFGLGGVFVEVMRDVSIRIHPLTDVDARSMVERVQGYPLLAGTRGDKPVAIDLIEECLLRLSQMIGDLEEHLAELDVNPLIVTDRREGSFVVDARISLSEG